ncbi:MAG: YidC/Oxa1 family membrane protein insertase [Clostridia bacterium]|nr:YidC/Oxa1 family membrane protein insertase [Clostridia bacterium]
MFEFFANTFGYVLNFIYNFVGNYGWAIILFTILVKLALLPLSIKQQKAMKKNAKIQEQVKAIQFKYKNDQAKMNDEIFNLYKTEKMSPFSGCLTTIIQLILLLSIFYLVRSPLTFMKKVPADVINNYTTQIQEGENNSNKVYPEIEIIRQKGQEDENVRVNMDFLGLDLSQIPKENMSDYRVWVIPVLYIISSFVSIKMTTNMQKDLTKKKEEKTDVIDVTDGKAEKVEQEETEVDVTMKTNKTMSWLMPIMAISIAIIAPLGLALYWLVNNILMIVERVALNKLLKSEEE